MIAIGDPVRAGFATNLARPDRNITGNTILGPDLIGKRLEVLKDCVPGLARVAFLWNPDNDSNLAFLEELIIAIPALGLQLISVPMRTSEALEPAFAAMMQRKPNAFATTNDPLIQRHRRDYWFHGKAPLARDVPNEGKCEGWRPDVIRHIPVGFVQTRRLVCELDFARCQTSGPAD